LSPDVIALIEEAARQEALKVAHTNDAKSRLAGATELVVPRALNQATRTW
jgi:fructoselysine-6-P-deglycase FrlB-like protein